MFTNTSRDVSGCLLLAASRQALHNSMSILKQQLKDQTLVQQFQVCLLFQHFCVCMHFCITWNQDWLHGVDLKTGFYVVMVFCILKKNFFAWFRIVDKTLDQLFNILCVCMCVCLLCSFLCSLSLICVILYALCVT